MRQNVNFIGSFLEKSESFQYQGDHQSANQFLDRGWIIKWERNGFWTITKPSSVYASFEDELNTVHTFNISRELLNFYERQRITERLYAKFKEEERNGLLKFYIEGGHLKMELR